MLVSFYVGPLSDKLIPNISNWAAVSQLSDIAKFHDLLFPMNSFHLLQQTFLAIHQTRHVRFFERDQTKDFSSKTLPKNDVLTIIFFIFPAWSSYNSNIMKMTCWYSYTNQGHKWCHMDNCMSLLNSWQNVYWINGFLKGMIAMTTELDKY